MPKPTALREGEYYLPSLGIRVTPARRFAFFAGVDALLVVASLALALILRFEGNVPAEYAASLPVFIPVAVGSTLALLFAFGVYRIAWSYVGLRDVGRVAAAVAGSTAVLFGIVQVLQLARAGPAFPRSVPIIQASILFCAISAFRLSKRAALLLRGDRLAADGKRTLLIGAGDAGAQVLDSIRMTGAPHNVLGFLDDDPLAQRTSIHGARVRGRVDQLTMIARREGAECVIICSASATSTLVHRVLALARAAGIADVRIVPPLSELVDGRVSISATREVRLEDLLGRDPVTISERDLAGLIQGRRILVTGAAGTIGSELCRQIAAYGPARLVALDVDESRLHDLVVDLRHLSPKLDVREALVDVRDMDELDETMHSELPQIVFHAAAFKHVPMMEKYPLHALEANVLGTLNAATAAEECGCETFVLISTDKAVEPSSVMGASKRLAEIVLFSRTASSSPRRMVRTAVRFGNVIGSRGSVIPTFERQLAAGGPLTVTHPEVERFFMMTSEAVSLVLQAAALGDDGDIFVLEMGKPVRILDVAREFVRLHGHEPDRDVAIVFTGLRPGEKLVEKLHYPEERLVPTAHPRLMRTRSRPEPDAEALLGLVRDIVARRDAPSARTLLRSRFPELATASEGVAVSTAAPPGRGLSR